MSNLKAPARIQGEWIWKKSLLNSPDSFLMMRREFLCNFVGLETNLWISANCAYQLFINGRFAGFGPRAHQNCGTSYMDLHEITYFLESGINVISVLVYYDVDSKGKNRRAPGLWCQMESQGHDILKSDGSWFVREAECYTSPRARVSKDQGMSRFVNAPDCPPSWCQSSFLADSSWSHPDHIVPVGEPGTRLELHPLAPPGTAVESPTLAPFRRGVIGDRPKWTQVVFEDCENNNDETYAANTFLYSECDAEVPVTVFADDPFKLFCNNTLLLHAEQCINKEVVLPIRTGWNRILFVQNPTRHGMGLFMLLPEVEEEDGEAFVMRFCRDTAKDCPVGWNVAGPLRLSLEEATSSIKFERLAIERYTPELEWMSDPCSYLRNCFFENLPRPENDMEALAAWNRPLRTDDYVIYKLDMMRYGFVSVVLEGGVNDIVDITIGSRMLPSGFVTPGENIRGTGTLVCRNGRNSYLTFTPDDCLYVMISIRRAAESVKVLSVAFEELTRAERQETLFNCSDEMLNKFWEIGRQTLRRSAAFVPLAESRADNDCYMLDAYIDAVNMAAVFGDNDYSSARLQQFVDAQLENGDIPALTFGSRHASQVHHLFFYPVWIYYNYRFTANISKLKQTLSSLDMMREFFEAMIDEKTGLLVETEIQSGLNSRLSFGSFKVGEIPTYLNALFCRFLLSSADIYRTVEERGKMEHCLKLAQQIATRLRESNFDPACSLFCRWAVESERMPDHNLFANFCAMFGGVLPLDSFEYFFYSFFNYDPPFDRSDESRHPYFHFLFMEMMFALGQRDWAFRYFRDYWSNRMCEESTAWRVSLDSEDPAPTSFIDGSGVSPNIFLLREVLGIRIAEAGHSVIYFNPAFKHIKSAEGMYPMVRGRLKVKWEVMEDGSLDVTLDSSIPVKILPEMSHKQIANTVFRLGERVTLLNPANDYDEEDDVILEDLADR